jgi:hypothetical protein
VFEDALEAWRRIGRKVWELLSFGQGVNFDERAPWRWHFEIPRQGSVFWWRLSS